MEKVRCACISERIGQEIKARGVVDIRIEDFVYEKDEMRCIPKRMNRSVPYMHIWVFADGSKVQTYWFSGVIDIIHNDRCKYLDGRECEEILLKKAGYSKEKLIEKIEGLPLFSYVMFYDKKGDNKAKSFGKFQARDFVEKSEENFALAQDDMGFYWLWTV